MDAIERPWQKYSVPLMKTIPAKVTAFQEQPVNRQPAGRELLLARKGALSFHQAVTEVMERTAVVRKYLAR
jgi:hypothetical protein